MMNYEWRKAIEAMRKEGYAVCVFSPEDLDGVDPSRVERVLTGLFNQIQSIGEDNDN